MLIWCDDADYFDNSATGSPYLRYPGSLATFVQVAAADGRFGQGSLDLVNSGFGEMNFTRFFAQRNKWYTGMAFKPMRALETSYNTLFFRYESVNAAGTVIAIRYNPSAELEVLTGGSGTNGAPGTLVATIPAGKLTLVLDTWVYLEFVLEQDGANSIFQVWADDVQILDMGPLGADGTIDLSSLGIVSNVTFRWQSLGKGYRIDDYYICDDQGTENNGRLGPVRMVTTIPAADSVIGLTRNTGTSDAGCVNELLWSPGLGPGLGVPDGDQTYLAATGGFDLWTISPFTCTALILAVALNGVYKGTGGVLTFLCEADTVGSASPTGSDYEGLQVIQELSLINPGFNWTDGEVNSALWGASPDIGRLTQYTITKVLTLRDVPYQCGTSPTTGNSYTF